MEKLINWSEVSRHVTNGGHRDCIRANKIRPKHLEALDKLFLEELPEWWRKESEKLKMKGEE